MKEVCRGNSSCQSSVTMASPQALDRDRSPDEHGHMMKQVNNISIWTHRDMVLFCFIF